MAKKYSLNVENDQVVSVEVDGVRYDSPDQIPSPEDRAKIRLLMSRPASESFDDAFGKDLNKEAEAEFRELERQTARFPIVIVAIFLAISVLALSMAAFSAVNTRRALSREHSAPGQVVDLVLRRDQAGRDYYYPVVEFDLPDDPRRRVQLAEGSWPPAYDKGQVVTVLYDPGPPLKARIASRSGTIAQWLVPAITGLLGAAFLIATLFSIWFLRPSSGRAQQDSSSSETTLRG